MTTQELTLAEARQLLATDESTLLAVTNRLSDMTIRASMAPDEYDAWKAAQQRKHYAVSRSVKRLRAWIATEEARERAAQKEADRAAKQEAIVRAAALKEAAKAGRVAEVERQHAEARRRREERQAVAQAERDRKAAAYASSTDEQRVLYHLYIALARRYKLAGEAPSEQDAETLDRAHALLTTWGMLE